MKPERELRKAKDRSQKTGRVPKNTQRVKPDPNAVPEPYTGPTITCKVRIPISGQIGTPADRGNIVELPPEVAEKYIEDGAVVLYEPVSLKDAVRAVKKAGGEISCDQDNDLLIQACEELAAEEGDVPVGVTMENTKAEIAAFAEKNGVEFDEKDTKQVILDKIAAGE